MDPALLAGGYCALIIFVMFAICIFMDWLDEHKNK